MNRSIVALMALGTLAGCAGSKGPTGVWLMEMGQMVTTEPVETVTHNYLNAIPTPDEVDDSGWTYDETESVSDSLMFGEIYELDDDVNNLVLVTNDTILPGLENEDGTFTFTWTSFDHLTDTETHTSGYNYTDSQAIDLVWSVTLDLGKDVGTGSLDLHMTQTRNFSETDLWNAEDIGQPYGQTPAEGYLDSTQENGYVANMADTTDCSASPCTIALSGDATATAPLQVWRSSVNGGDFTSVEYATQDSGLGGFQD